MSQTTGVIEWISVDTKTLYQSVYKAKVDGGYLYMLESNGQRSITFVPDNSIAKELLKRIKVVTDFFTDNQSKISTLVNCANYYVRSHFDWRE